MYRRKYAFQNRLGLLVVGRKSTIFALFYFVFEGKFQAQASRGAYIRMGDLTEGFLRYDFWGRIHEGACFRNFTVLFFLFPAKAFVQTLPDSLKRTILSCRYLALLCLGFIVFLTWTTNAHVKVAFRVYFVSKLNDLVKPVQAFEYWRTIALAWMFSSKRTLTLKNGN